MSGHCPKNNSEKLFIEFFVPYGETYITVRTLSEKDIVASLGPYLTNFSLPYLHDKLSVREWVECAGVGEYTYVTYTASFIVRSR